MRSTIFFVSFGHGTIVELESGIKKDVGGFDLSERGAD